MSEVQNENIDANEFRLGKKCSICKTVQGANCFAKRHDKPDGLTNVCRTCKNAYDKKRRMNPEYRERKKILTQRRRAELTVAQNYPLLAEMRCTQCGITKDVDEFALSRRALGGRRGHCRECTISY